MTDLNLRSFLDQARQVVPTSPESTRGKSLVARMFSNLLGKQASAADLIAQLVPGITRATVRRGTAELLGAHGFMPALRMVTGKLAEAVSEVELSAGYWDSGGDWEDLPDHPLQTMLDAGTGVDPNGVPGLTGRQIRKLTNLHLDLVGEAFWLLARNNAGMPVATFPVPPHWIIQLPSPTVPAYQLTVPHGGYSGPIAATEIVMFRDVDPLDPYRRGSGIAAALYDELRADEESGRYTAEYLQNNARPDLVITGTKEQPFSEADAASFERKWLPKFRGNKGAGRPLFARGNVQIQEIGQGIGDLGIVDLRSFLRDYIIQVYGAPPEKFGILSASNRATIDAADFFFAKDVIRPRVKRMVETINVYLAPQYDPRLRVLPEEIVPEDKAFQLEVMKARPHDFARSDAQELAGVEFDEAAWGADVFPKSLSVTLVEVGQEPAPPIAPTPPPPPPGTVPEDDEEEEVEEEPEERAILQRATNIILRDAAAKMGLVSKLTGDDVVSISTAIDDPNVVAEAQRVYESLLVEMTEAFGRETIEGIGEGLAYQMTEEVRQWTRDYSARLVRGINRTTSRNIAAAIADPVADGAPVEKIADAVRSVFTQASEVRARTIAMTESTTAAGVGGLDGMRQAGVTMKQWLTTMDGHEREDHAALNGQTAGTDESFETIEGARALHPGGFGVAALDIGCRCAISPYFPGQDDGAEARAARYTIKENERQRQEEIARRTAQAVFEAQQEVTLAMLRSLSGG